MLIALSEKASWVRQRVLHKGQSVMH
jgi:hypothetical protein